MNFTESVNSQSYSLQGTYFAGGVLLVCTMLLYNDRSSIKVRKGRLSSNALRVISKLPSVPILGPSLQIWLQWNELLSLFLEWQRVFGRCWRAKLFGMDVVTIHEPEYLKVVLESRDVRCLQKTFMYNHIIVGPFKTGMFNREAESWGPRRHTLNRLFTYDAIKDYVSIFKKHGDLLVKQIHSVGKTKLQGESFEKDLSITDAIFCQTLDAISEVFMGKPASETLSIKECLEFHHHLEAYKDTMTDKIYKKPWLLIPFVWWIHPQKRKLDKVLNALESFVTKIRKSYVSGPDCSRQSVVDLLTQERWPEREIIGEILTLFVAGHETTSSTFIMHLWNMALEKNHQITCRQEVDSLFDKLELSGEEFNINATNELRFVERCIKETLRLFPVLTVGAGRELKTRVSLGNDVTLEAGTNVIYIPYVLHRDPENFPDPEKFDPDRFLPENAKGRCPYAYLPFSAGPRNCIGWKTALLELKILTAVILRNFELSTTDNKEDIKVEFGFILKLARQPNIIFKVRDVKDRIDGNFKQTN